MNVAGYQLLPVLPELVLAIGAMVLLMIGAYRGQQTTSLVTGLAVCLLVVVGALELWLPSGKLTTFNGSFIVDDFARFLKILALIGSAATLILSAEFLADPSRRIFEYAILVLLSTLGMMVLISAGDLIMLYLGLELMSLALYVVAASNRDNAKSTEAGLKYFVLGALSSGMLLYGASLIYGFTGTVSFAGIAAVAENRQRRHRLRAGVPARRALLQDLGGAVSHVDARRLRGRADAGHRVLCLRAEGRRARGLYPRGADGFSGHCAAMAADRGVRFDRLDGAGVVRRHRAEEHQAADGLFVDRPYGVCAGRARLRDCGGRAGRADLYLDLCGDDAGQFCGHPDHEAQWSAFENISDFAGLSRTNPLLAFFFAMLLFSLAGIPPLAGFFAKFYVFVAAIKAGLFTLAVIGVLASVVGAFYYLTIIKVMYFDEPLAKLDPMRMELRTVLAVAGLFNIFFFVYPGPLVSVATAAAKSLF